MPHFVPVAPNVQSDYPVGLEQGARYVLTGPDGTRAVLNDRSDPDFVGFLTAPPSGFDSPDVRESADVVVEGDGGVHGRFYFGRRPWTLAGLIDPTPGPNDYVETVTAQYVNLHPNPGAEVDAAGYVAGTNAVAAVRSTTTANAGAASARITATAGGNMTSRFVIALPGGGGPSVGQPFNWSVSVRTAAARSVRLGVTFLDAANAAIGATSSSGSTALAANTWTALAYTTGAIPVGTVSVQIEVVVLAALAAELAYVDTNTVTVGTAPPIVFDGDTLPGAFPNRTSWTGTAGSSTSTYSLVTRTPMGAGQVANRRINRLQRASRALRADAVLTWTPAGGLPVQVEGRRQSPLRIVDRLPKTFQLAMVSAERRILGQTVKSVSGVGTANLTVRNDGNTNGSPVITLRETWTNAILTNQNTGEALRLTANGGLAMGAGDVVVIDVAAKTITKNGVNVYSLLAFPTSAWWETLPGDTVVVPTGAGTGGNPGTWQIDAQDAWE